LIVAAKRTTIATMDTTSNLSRCAERRNALQLRMGKGVAIIPTAPERIRNRDSDYLYRFDSYFYYLSGFPEPEAVLVLLAGEEPRSILFCRERNPERELWEGVRKGPRAQRLRLVSKRPIPWSRSTSTCRSSSPISLRFTTPRGRRGLGRAHHGMAESGPGAGARRRQRACRNPRRAHRPRRDASLQGRRRARRDAPRGGDLGDRPRTRDARDPPRTQ